MSPPPGQSCSPAVGQVTPRRVAVLVAAVVDALDRLTRPPDAPVARGGATEDLRQDVRERCEAGMRGGDQGR